MICEKCGTAFTQTGSGRRRKVCYECRPARLNQRGGQNDDAARTKRANITAGQSVAPSSSGVSLDGEQLSRRLARQCGHCHAYLDPRNDSAFCNPAHRAAFADKVAAATERKRADTQQRRVNLGNLRRRGMLPA